MSPIRSLTTDPRPPSDGSRPIPNPQDYVSLSSSRSTSSRPRSRDQPSPCATGAYTLRSRWPWRAPALASSTCQVFACALCLKRRSASFFYFSRTDLGAKQAVTERVIRIARLINHLLVVEALSPFSRRSTCADPEIRPRSCLARLRARRPRRVAASGPGCPPRCGVRRPIRRGGEGC
jgi:hypothetical protein